MAAQKKKPTKRKSPVSAARKRAEEKATAANKNIRFGTQGKPEKGAAAGPVGNLSALQQAMADAKARREAAKDKKSTKSVKPTGALKSKSAKSKSAPPTPAEIAARIKANKAKRKKKKN